MRVVDLSADFRLRSLGTYEHWYGAHPHPELLEHAVYGLTELHRERIAGAATSSPTPAATRPPRCSALAPLARAGLIADVVIDAKQGVSGAGRASDETTHLSSAGENIVPYKVAAHRHTPEIEEQLGAARRRRLSGAVPAASRAARPGRAGQLLRHADARRRRTRSCAALYADAYAERAVRRAGRRPPGVRDVRETNFCRCSPPPTGAPARCSCSPRSTTSGRAPPPRRCRTST